MKNELSDSGEEEEHGGLVLEMMVDDWGKMEVIGCGQWR